MSFVRTLKRGLLQSLKKEALFKNKLKKDCQSQKVFLALRNVNIDFYHKGGRLFEFDQRGFHTHLKYAAVIPKQGKDYLTEKELSKPKAKYQLASNFIKSYSRIKENCSNYSGKEALGVSCLYHKHSYHSMEEVVVLDIEISFEGLSDDKIKTQDRIDILLFNKKTTELQFVEAKHYSNKEIWSDKDSIPKVISQLDKYEKQIKSKKQTIINEYSDYVHLLNSIFQISLPNPTMINDRVKLLIFGFDRDQQNGRLKDLIIQKPEYSAYNIYAKGNIKNVEMKKIWWTN